LHMAQLMPLPLTVSCSSKIQIGFTFLVPAHPGSPGKRAVKRVCECVCVSVIRMSNRRRDFFTSLLLCRFSHLCLTGSVASFVHAMTQRDASNAPRSNCRRCPVGTTPNHDAIENVIVTETDASATLQRFAPP